MIGHLPVEGQMFAAMHHLLLDEGRNLARQPVRRAIAKGADTLDEIGFAARKGDGQGVEESRGDRIAIQPMSGRSAVPAETAVARRDSEVGRGHLALLTYIDVNKSY